MIAINFSFIVVMIPEPGQNAINMQNAQSDKFVLSECADVDILLHMCTLGFLEVQ